MGFKIRTFFQKNYENLFIPEYLKEDFDFKWQKSMETDFFGEDKREDMSTQLNLKKAPLHVIFSRRQPLAKSFISKQVHGTILNHILKYDAHKEGDALFIQGVLSSLGKEDREPFYMTVKTADCLSVVLYYLEDDVLLASNVHAGWRGYSSGILGASLDEMIKAASYFSLSREDILKSLNVLICPAIFAVSYECSIDVLRALENHGEGLRDRVKKPQLFEKFFRKLCHVSENFSHSKQLPEGKIFPDLQLLAMLELNCLGVPLESIEIIRENTYSHPFFYSHRQDCRENTQRGPSFRHFTNFFLPRLQNVSLPNVFNHVKS